MVLSLLCALYIVFVGGAIFGSHLLGKITLERELHFFKFDFVCVNADGWIPLMFLESL